MLGELLLRSDETGDFSDDSDDSDSDYSDDDDDPYDDSGDDRDCGRVVAWIESLSFLWPYLLFYSLFFWKFGLLPGRRDDRTLKESPKTFSPFSFFIIPSGRGQGLINW